MAEIPTIGQVGYALVWTTPRVKATWRRDVPRPRCPYNGNTYISVPVLHSVALNGSLFKSGNNSAENQVLRTPVADVWSL
ncbi:hypothetical protein T09_3780 [Trichinella sp. T9]|uniref:Uncharacterized protein n=1 Tax=Trichinella murrelli TaxID=144512 RepID=A0A0V0TK31_9BILA|nr:hypothetical protein T05_3142 [Trichinella murrelli]KRX59678.1 hypothetical protein T09_3780 [Trichinella sp. T9]